MEGKKDAGKRTEIAAGGQYSSKLVPVSVCSSAEPVSHCSPASSSLSQLEYFVSHQPGRKPGQDLLQVSEVHSERKTEQLTKSAVEIITLAKESHNVLENKTTETDDCVVETCLVEDNTVKSTVVGQPVALEFKELSETLQCNVKKQEGINAEVVLPIIEETVRNTDVTSRPTKESSVFMVQSDVEESSDFVIDLTKSPKSSEDRLSEDSIDLTPVKCLANNGEATADLENSKDATSKSKPVCSEVKITEEAKPATSNDEDSTAKATNSNDAAPLTHNDANLESKSGNVSDVNFEARLTMSHNATLEFSDVKNDDMVPEPATNNDGNLEAKCTHSKDAGSEEELAIDVDAAAESKPVISDDSESKVSHSIDDKMKMFTSDGAASVEAKPTVSSDESSETQHGSYSHLDSDAEPTNSTDAKLKMKLATCDDAVVDFKPVTSDSAISETKPADSDDVKEKGDVLKPGDAKSQKKYQTRVSSRQGFATPMKERVCSKKLTRKRINSIGFSKRSSKAKHVRKCNDRKLCATVAASKVCQKRKLNVDVLPELGARRSQKELIESKAKVFTSVGSICKRKTGSEKEKLRRHLSEETVNQQTNGPKCWKWREPGSMKLTYTEVSLLLCF